MATRRSTEVPGGSIEVIFVPDPLIADEVARLRAEVARLRLRAPVARLCVAQADNDIMFESNKDWVIAKYPVAVQFLRQMYAASTKIRNILFTIQWSDQLSFSKPTQEAILKSTLPLVIVASREKCDDQFGYTETIRVGRNDIPVIWLAVCDDAKKQGFHDGPHNKRAIEKLRSMLGEQ